MKKTSNLEAWLLVAGFLLMVFVAGNAPGYLSVRVGENPRILGLAPWQLLSLGILVVLGVLAYRLSVAIASRIVALSDHREGGIALDRRLLRRSAGIISAALVLMPFVEELSLPSIFDRDVTVTLHAALIIGVVLLVVALWDALCDRIAHRASNNDRAERLLVPVTRKLVRVVILMAGGAVAIGVFGVNIAGLLAGLGIGGLVVALAAKDSVENVFGSLTILFDMPFALGDWVKIDKVEGVVEEINLRSTRVRTFDDTLINLPNANLIRAAVENYGARRTRRQKILVRLPYDSPPDALQAYCDAVRDHVNGLPDTPEGRSIVAVSEFNDATLAILVQTYFVADTQAGELALRHSLMLELMRLATIHKLRIANAAPVEVNAEVMPS